MKFSNFTSLSLRQYISLINNMYILHVHEIRLNKQKVKNFVHRRCRLASSKYTHKGDRTWCRYFSEGYNKMNEGRHSEEFFIQPPPSKKIKILLLFDEWWCLIANRKRDESWLRFMNNFMERQIHSFECSPQKC